MKRILALVLTIVMLFSMVACDFFSKPKNNSNENTTPQVTVTEPEGTQPEGTQPEGTQPEGTEPEGTEPGTNPGVTPDFEIELPKASELIANIIGVVAATVEVSKDAQIVFVVEQDDESNDYNGFKQVLFLEVVEASVDSDGEVLKAHLKVKVGDACVDIPENGSANDLVVGKNDIVSYYEISVDVDGDNVSYSFNEENASADLSELLWGTVANMMGLSGIEELKQVIKTAYIAQELEKYLIPIIAQAIEGVFQELPTVSPAYGEHVAELFAALGQDIITVTVDDVTGYTTYSLNIAAFKALIADIEDKTLAEYLEGIYGENVVGALSEFLKTLPEKKVKDIVDAAVALAEGTGATIEEIYALIDLYVLNATGVEFSIEEQINERYNNTLIELLAEMSSIAPEDQETFVEGIKTSFTQAAEVIETVKVDALLSSMFLGAEEGFFEGLKATIDMFDEQIKVNATDYKKYWQVFDRTAGEEIDGWEYIGENIVRIFNAKKYHEYTVNFFGKNLWNSTQVYNYTCNGWTITKDRDVDPIFPEAFEHILNNNYCEVRNNVCKTKSTNAKTFIYYYGCGYIVSYFGFYEQSS